ncbi:MULTISPECIES: ExbD/TolR family protein [Methylotuvimicrobium]|uniref:Biopolymer transport protein exbD2 n=2 Tax=Methylotuvimicrobium TaxID=2822410 RepID=G4T211_META2|nr:MULTISPECIES: biopolymer transporter ExbD [Methylotuvimicrobium]QCW83538.1 biopolymer transporter ExbD [Methylotuvimicrobium buryatense]CCE24685.1 Biopolymer transport protein exbD2 [Methylotuvimicrobium alcaliphilum 20Z]
MQRQHTRQPSFGAGLNVTPLIDMVFILLIFFVVNSSFVKETGVEVDRPTAQTAERQDQAGILIAVTKDGEVWIEQQQVDVRAVRGHVERLHAESPEASALILADKRSETGIVMQVLDQARLAGIARVAVAASEEL